MKEIGEERKASRSVCCTTVQHRRACSCRSRDEGRRRVGEGNDERCVRAIVLILSVVEVVDSEVASIIEVDIKLASKVPPEFRQLGREHDEEVGASLDVAVQALGAEVGGEAWGGESQPVKVPPSSKDSLLLVGENKTRCSNASVSWSRTVPCASFGDLKASS